MPPLLALRGATIHGPKGPLFDNLELSLSSGERACLVGRNGAGKSTLLHVLAGLKELDAGMRFSDPKIRVGLLRQNPVPDPARSARDHLLATLGGDEAWSRQHEAEALLDEFGLDADMRAGTLSGGALRRLSLAETLLSRPDILLLDEPTNHLDLAAIEALEARLETHRGALLIVSHDRAFLERLSTATLWLDRGIVRRLDKGFACFEDWRDRIFEEEACERAKLDKLIADETRWSHEGITARRTRNMGRMRRLDELRKERARQIAKEGVIRLESKGTASESKLVIEASNIARKFGEKDVLKPFSIRIAKGDKIGIVGPNGAGKTTLIRLLSGALEPDSGTIRRASDLSVKIIDQKRTFPPHAVTIRDFLSDGTDQIIVNGAPVHVATYMKSFLFDPSRADSPLSSLSGGEQARLMLARDFADPVDLLILDEPTNDLDFETLDILEDVLAGFPGTLLLVSHDRAFLDRVVTSTIAFDAPGKAAEYAGGWTDYLRQRPAAATSRMKMEKPEKISASIRERPKTTRKLSYHEQRELDNLPAEIGKIAAALAAQEKKLADSSLYIRDPAGFNRLTAEHAALQAKIGEMETRWLELEEKRTALEAG